MDSKSLLFTTSQQTGQTKLVRTFKRRRGCSAVIRVCKNCKRKSIHPNDALYKMGFCFVCSAARPGCPSSGPVASRSRPSGKGRKPHKQKKTFENIHKFAKRIQGNLPRSEVWFQSNWLAVKDPDDEYNVPFAGLIPDCINRRYKYIIEIDGSIHDKKKQKRRDLRKDKAFESHGYDVLRLKAFDKEGLNCLIEIIERKRLSSVKSRPTFILRKNTG